MPQHEDGVTPNMWSTTAGPTGRPRFPKPVVILVVEDEALVSMNVCEFLVDQEFTVFAAQDVDEALDLLRQLDGGVDLIFTDVNMPGERNGFDLAREVSSRWPAVHVMITSGGCSQNALPADLQHFGPIMSKPYDLSVLASRIIEAIFPPSEPVNLLTT